MNGSMVNPETVLQALRAEIDEVDAKIVGLLAERFRVTGEVGKLKARHALAAVDPRREAAQEARFRELARQRGLNPDLVVRIFRAIIDEVVENHRKV
jgi:chorismate mutase